MCYECRDRGPLQLVLHRALLLLTKNRSSFRVGNLCSRGSRSKPSRVSRHSGLLALRPCGVPTFLGMQNVLLSPSLATRVGELLLARCSIGTLAEHCSSRDSPLVMQLATSGTRVALLQVVPCRDSLAMLSRLTGPWGFLPLIPFMTLRDGAL